MRRAKELLDPKHKSDDGLVKQLAEELRKKDSTAEEYVETAKIIFQGCKTQSARARYDAMVKLLKYATEELNEVLLTVAMLINTFAQTAEAVPRLEDYLSVMRSFAQEPGILPAARELCKGSAAQCEAHEFLKTLYGLRAISQADDVVSVYAEGYERKTKIRISRKPLLEIFVEKYISETSTTMALPHQSLAALAEEFAKEQEALAEKTFDQKMQEWRDARDLEKIVGGFKK